MTNVNWALGSQRRGRVSRLVPLRGSKLRAASPLGEATGVIGHGIIEPMPDIVCAVWAVFTDRITA
ncbi:hypothetical protein [Nostoc sp.]|uniref:hypothetical protein n=1 Tax=Nostoc sp. TaxID=1180 RepID=UPI002FFB0B72